MNTIFHRQPDPDGLCGVVPTSGYQEQLTDFDRNKTKSHDTTRCQFHDVMGQLLRARSQCILDTFVCSCRLQAVAMVIPRSSE